MPSRKTWFLALVVAVLLYLLVVHSGTIRLGAHTKKFTPSVSTDVAKDKNSIDDKFQSKGGEPAKKTQSYHTGASDVDTPIFKAADEKTNNATPGKLVPEENTKIFKDKPLVIWSNDFHIGPIQDLKHLLAPLGVKFIDKSLSGHCHLTKTCAKGLRVVNGANGINLPPNIIPQFYEAYKNDPEMQSVDAFVCFHPTSMCELFMPFGKSLIVIASTRYEMGRHDPARWSSWNKNLIKIAQDPKNVVAGNNLYDAKYIEYFTGIEPQVLTSYCGYIPETYNPTREEFLLAPVHHGQFQGIFLKEFSSAVGKLGSQVKLVPLRQKYAHYKYSDLTAHQGMVYVPYQVSVMSLFEQYRMNIPLFFPSLDLLTEWQYTYHVMNERTWMQVYGKIPNGSPIPGVKTGVPDPNNETSKEALRYWIQYADFYKFPHIIHYDSYEDLVRKMEKTDLKAVGEKMKEYNISFKKELLGKWVKILKNISSHSENHKTS